jgi:TolB protein
VDGQTDIWATPAPQNGGSPVRLTTDGDARAPAWSPDGSQLAYVKVDATGADLFVMPLGREGGSISGGEPARLTTEGQIDANSGLSWGK